MIREMLTNRMYISDFGLWDNGATWQRPAAEAPH